MGYVLGALRGTSRKAERTTIRRSRFTILPTHRPLATRFGQDTGCQSCPYRSLALWLLGYPEAALADAEHALKHAREIGHAATLMYALWLTFLTHFSLRKLRSSKRARR